MNNQTDDDKIRLNKFLAERLGVSRRQADDLIADGMISWRHHEDTKNDGSHEASNNWKIAKLGDRIDKSYEVCYNGSKLGKSGQDFDEPNRGDNLNPKSSGSLKREANVKSTTLNDSSYPSSVKSTPKLPFFVKNLEKTPDGRFLVPWQTEFLYYGFNKPVGYVCSRRAQGNAPTIYDILPKELRSLKTVGRLDKDSSGLILLTNDGDFAYQMTHPKFIKEKIYLVELDHDLAPLHQQEIADFGVEIGDGVSRLGLVRLSAQEFSEAMGENLTEKVTEERKFFRVTMSEGRNRQIRRTFAALGYEVVRLHRVQFGKYCLGDLAPNEYMKVPKV